MSLEDEETLYFYNEYGVEEVVKQFVTNQFALELILEHIKELENELEELK